MNLSLFRKIVLILFLPMIVLILSSCGMTGTSYFCENTLYESKDEVLEELKKRFDNNKELLDTYVGNNNIFPNSLIISVNDINKIEKIVEKVSEFKNIETVMSKQKTIDEIHKNLDTLSEEDIDLIIESID